MNILVTGATGFIGRRLVEELLNRNYDVRIISRQPIEAYKISWSKKVISIQGDLKDKDSIHRAVQGADVVIHLAAQLGSWQAKEKDYYDINVDGTKVLVEESKKADIQHFIYISTAGVYGRLKHVPADEFHPCNPRYLYEKTKYLAEQYILGEIRKGFPATILRPSHVYGPGDLNTVPLLRLLKSVHFFPLIGGGKSLFQPVFIDDLIEGIIRCLENRKIVLGKVYVLAGKEAIVFREYIRLISKLMGIKVLTTTCPYLFTKLAAFINELFARIFNVEPVLTRFRVDFFGGHQCYDIQLARRDFNYDPKVGLKQGLEKAINWYRSARLI